MNIIYVVYALALFIMSSDGLILDKALGSCEKSCTFGTKYTTLIPPKTVALKGIQLHNIQKMNCAFKMTK